MTGQYITTPTNMVGQIRSIIEGYAMGNLRALAQEPVQNAKDEKTDPRVQVEYQLHRRQTAEGSEYYLLTITDSGTGGLKGPVLTPDELDSRGYKLNDGENWAAFEGQGFTEKGGGDLGTRGQGKSAFLYHSDPTSVLGDDRERALMLYDTLLKTGEYRLGVRYAKPNDTIRHPPFYHDDAQLTIMDKYEVEEGLWVDLNLEPLEEPGARIIVPFVKESAVKAIQDGELHRWLQRCWWRAIQTGEIEIRVTDADGNTQTIEVPSWWQGEPWERGDTRARQYLDIPVGDGLLIKRVVLYYDPNLKEEEIQGHDAQYRGVQLLRGRQWIETQDVRDEVPSEFRGGFRGFAEFDRRLEAELKNSERSQHESFNGRYRYVPETRQRIREKVRELATEQGWTTTATNTNASRRDQEHAADFLATFTRGNNHRRNSNNANGMEERNRSTYQWECQLWADFPDPMTTRVNWGEYIRNITVMAEVKPVPESRWATLTLEVTREGEKSSTLIRTTELEITDGHKDQHLGDLQVVKGQAHSGQVRCPEPGYYRLTANISHLGQNVATATRKVYIEVDPPEAPTQNPFTVSISARNISRPGERRINSGDEVMVKITAKNRTNQAASLELDASIGDLLLCDGTAIEIPGTPAGESPSIKSGYEGTIILYTQSPLLPSDRATTLEPGRHFIRADLRVRSEEAPVAHASHTIFFEIDPDGGHPDLPFELEAIEEEGSHPMWELYQRNDGRYVLRYHARNPIYRELPESSRSGNKLNGQRSFITEVCAAGLLEWGITPLVTRDSSRLDLMKESAADGLVGSLPHQYLDKLERIEQGYETIRKDEPGHYDKLKRETIADMILIFEERA